jgi:hypothetical protein
MARRLAKNSSTNPNRPPQDFSRIQSTPPEAWDRPPYLRNPAFTSATEVARMPSAATP